MVISSIYNLYQMIVEGRCHTYRFATGELFQNTNQWFELSDIMQFHLIQFFIKVLSLNKFIINIYTLQNYTYKIRAIIYQLL